MEAHHAQDFPYNSYAPRLTSFTGFRVLGEEDDSVAFMAVLAENFTVTERDIPIVMDKVLLNTGGAYDSLTGSFLCLDNKLYMFSHTATIDSNINNGIYMDGVRIRRNRTTYLSSSSSATSGSSTRSVIIHCQEGSRVHIMHEAPDSPHVRIIWLITPLSLDTSCQVKMCNLLVFPYSKISVPCGPIKTS